MLKKHCLCVTALCTDIQFLQASQLYWAMILLSFALYLRSASVSNLHGAIHIIIFCLHPSLYLLVS